MSPKSKSSPNGQFPDHEWSIGVLLDRAGYQGRYVADIVYRIVSRLLARIDDLREELSRERALRVLVEEENQRLLLRLRERERENEEENQHLRNDILRLRKKQTFQNYSFSIFKPKPKQ